MSSTASNGSMKFRASFSLDNSGEIKGSIATNHAEPDFTMECMLLILEDWSKRTDVPINELLTDLWALHVEGLKRAR